MAPPPLDLSKPKWDQNNYMGRLLHFFKLTNPMNLLASDEELNEAKKVVAAYKKSKRLPAGYTEDMMWNAKYLADSAFHPDTGEKMILPGRMSAQVPVNTFLVGGMLTFYRSKAATVFWQWLNQTLMAGVNYSNRSGDQPISKSQLAKSYCTAVTGAVGTALFLNSRAQRMKNPLFQKLVPFAAVAAANCINIPMMRSSEIERGTPVFTPTGERLGESKNAAKRGVFLTCISRIIMAIPGMVLPPIVTAYGVRAGWFCRYPSSMLIFQITFCALCIAVATPFACAIFNQQAPISVCSLEKDLAEKAKKKRLDYLVYNKGL